MREKKNAFRAKIEAGRHGSTERKAKTQVVLHPATIVMVLLLSFVVAREHRVSTKSDNHCYCGVY